MSTAHRPTWDPAQAKEVKGGSRQVSARDHASHTKLKFRQPGQTSTTDVAKRDLRMELLEAEHAARDKKRKAEGKAPLEDAPRLTENVSTEEDNEANKRRKMLQEALELDKDDDDSSEDEERSGANKDGENAGSGDEGSEDDDSDDDEDDTAELMRELERIKRERAEEKERQEREQNASSQLAREEEIATANPLLNLAAALGQNTGVNTTAPGTFAVKRRWDDDLIFKNQASSDRPSGQFVNDLLRTEFHKKFMSRFIK